MARIGDRVDRLIRKKGLVAARAVLFPELGDERVPRLVEGLFRARRWGVRPPPVLSVCPADDPTSATRFPGVASPARMLAERGWETPELLARAAAARKALVAARVGGPWWEAGAEPTLPREGLAVVALAEPAPPGGGAGRGAAPDTAAAMLDAAISAFPPAQVVVLAPPRIARRPCPRLEAARARGLIVVDRACDPWPLLDRAERVYSIGGEIGFLALLAGLPVTAFAAAPYTGWGVTEDAAAVPQHGFRRSPDEIFAGIALVATRCRDPFRNAATSFEEALAILADWRRIETANRRIAVCVGMSFWKQRRVADFVRSAANAPAYKRTVEAALTAAIARRGAIAGWASRLPEGLAEAAATAGVVLIRVEDGFIRSVGLGSDFMPPASLVFDETGMYYDPRGGSDLERLLDAGDFPPALTARAERLRKRLVERGITKYILAGGDVPPEMAAGIPHRPRILVPGQVEDDLSIRCGTGEVRTNLALLARVRAAKPDAFIVYKPHPDVVAGHRIGAVPEAEARRFADLVVSSGSTDRLLAVSHEVHTMTSLTGFEALLRRLRVVVYGRPFYAGWGLTTDLPAFDRGRRLTLDQLVAGVLILYPRYLDPVTRLPCGPEILIDRLEKPELWRAGPLVRARRLQGRLSRGFAARRPTPASPGSRPDEPTNLRPLAQRPRT
jgi:capsular polysaccharide export protein